MTWLADVLQSWPVEWLGPDEDPTLFPGTDPAGAASIALDLENGYTVTMRWPTDIIKRRDGSEQRISRLDRPKESYQGSALLFDDDRAAIRATLARQAASGSAFVLGLPHEELSIRQAASGATVYVPSTTACDWLNPGQRVLVVRDGDKVEGIVQSSTSTSITIDVAPGAVGGIGGRIMPAATVYLEPQQTFPRYRTRAERWDIVARSRLFGFAPSLPTLALGPLTAAAGLENASVTARTASSTALITFSDNGPFDAGTLVEGSNAVVLYKPGVTTVADVYALLQTSVHFNPTGTWGSGTLTAITDEFPLTQLTQAQPEGPVGTGASVSTYDGRPIWDARLENADTIADGIETMVEIVDYDAQPYTVAMAAVPDWTRAVVFTGEHGLDWQWLKLFLATTKGPQKAFWLPTWREDLGYTSHTGADVTVTGDIAAWWPAQRQHVMVIQSDGTRTYAEVTAVAGQVLTLSSSLSASPIELISWLELCRFESPDFSVTFTQEGFEMTTTARVVQS